MTKLRRGLLAFAVSAGVAAGASVAAADGPGKSPDRLYVPTAWQGLYGGVHLGHGEVGNFDDGVLGGLQIGRNWQSGAVVYGIEGDVSFSGMEHVDWMATVRGRLGYLISPGILLYGTAGLGIVDVHGTETDFVYGLGIEGKLTPGTTVRLEYIGFADTEIDVIRVGLNFKLGGW
jgi:outer membrane immunogenic protein